MVKPTSFEPDNAELTPDPERFEGDVARVDLFRAGGALRTDVTGVVFAPGARTVPHTHTVDQILFAVEGEGQVSLDGVVHLMHPGDWIVVPANTHHWHGATDSIRFVQMALKAGGETDWLPRDHEWAEPAEPEAG